MLGSKIFLEIEHFYAREFESQMYCSANVWRHEQARDRLFDTVGRASVDLINCKALTFCPQYKQQSHCVYSIIYILLHLFFQCPFFTTLCRRKMANTSVSEKVLTSNHFRKSDQVIKHFCCFGEWRLNSKRKLFSASVCQNCIFLCERSSVIRLRDLLTAIEFSRSLKLDRFYH